MFKPMEFVEQLLFGNIHIAARKGQIAQAEKLLRLDRNLVKATLESMTPLHYAADGCHLDMLRLLLKYGADANAKDRYGRTPLHFCVMRNFRDGVSLLLANGANPDVASSSSFLVTRRHLINNAVHEEFVTGTPMDVAIALRNSDISQLLRRYEGHRADELAAAS